MVVVVAVNWLGFLGGLCCWLPPIQQHKFQKGSPKLPFPFRGEIFLLLSKLVGACVCLGQG